MKALVISGGGSKGAFAGGIAEYLIREKKNDYNIFVGTSTGSLMLTHLALGKVKELKKLYSNVDQHAIFSICPFRIKKTGGQVSVGINHFNTLRNFLRGSKTFGESHNLKKLIDENIKDHDLKKLNKTGKIVLATVSNLTLNQVEFKAASEHSYQDFRDFIWASSNFVPFMSLMVKNNYEYADGGFANLVPIHEAIRQGATEIDAIVLETEISQVNRMPSKNPFGLITNLFSYMQMHVEKYNISIGKLEAEQNKVKLNLYYTPMILTTNTLIFDKDKMRKLLRDGFNYAKKKQD